MSAFNPTLRCPCDKAHLEEALTYDAAPAGETKFDLGVPYVRAYDRCTACNHFFGRHDIDLSKLYSSDYVNVTYGGPDGMRAKLDKILALPPEKSDNAGRVARVVAFAKEFWPSKPSPRLLDVGAGLGVFPAGMKAAGWQACGVEPDARTVQHLKDVVGIEAWAEDLFDLPPETTGLFDAVSLNKVLEHVEDPVALLTRAVQFLKPDGFFYIEMPDVAAAIEGGGREEFFIEHHHVFSPESLAMLISRAGLVVKRMERLREPSGKYTLVAFCGR